MFRSLSAQPLIARKTALIVAGFVLLFSGIRTGFQLHNEYHRSVDQVRASTEQHMLARVEGLRHALWVIDKQEALALLEHLVEDSNIHHAQVIVDGSPEYQFGDLTIADDIRMRQPIYHEHRGQQRLLGTLEVASSLDEVLARSRQKLLILAATSIGEAMLLIVVLLFVVQRLLTRHLGRLAEQAGRVASGQLRDSAFQLERKNGQSPDELDQLANALSSMASQLLRTQESLEARVKARTLDLESLNHELAQAERIAGLGSWTCGLDGHCPHWSEKMFEIMGYDQQVQKPCREAFVERVIPADRQRFVDLIESSFKTGQSYEIDVTLGYEDDSRRRVHIIGDFIDDEMMRGTVQDITEAWEAAKRLEQASVIVESAAEGIGIADHAGCLQSVNPAFAQITGYAADELIGQSSLLLDSGQHSSRFYLRAMLKTQRKGTWQGEIWVRRKSGDIFPIWLALSAIKGDDGLNNYVGVLTDISEVYEARQKLQQMAHHDPLTGLPNRLLLNLRLDRALRRARRHHNSVAVLFLDLDRFKEVNDSLGHPVGDQLLKQCAQRLQKLVRDTDTVARQGGDEFVLILDDLPDVGGAREVGAKIIRALREPFDLAGQEITIGASVGISIYPGDADDAATLLRNADAAMYQAKEEGRNRLHEYTSQLTDSSKQRLQFEAGLRQSLLAGELDVHYQPVWNTWTRQVLGVEALVRWHHPTLGPVPARQIVDNAERCGLAAELTAFVLARALSEFGNLTVPESERIRLSVNMPGALLSSGDVVELLQEQLLVCPSMAQRLVVEVTENALLHNPERAAQSLNKLREMGVSVAIDDFGTGYSAMNYLKHLPCDMIKIDQSFIRDISSDRHDRVICRTIIALAQSLGMSVVAEGVENEAQLKFLIEQGCEMSQGHLVAPALPVDELERFLRNEALVKKNPSLTGGELV